MATRKVPYSKVLVGDVISLVGKEFRVDKAHPYFNTLSTRLEITEVFPKHGVLHNLWKNSNETAYVVVMEDE